MIKLKFQDEFKYMYGVLDRPIIFIIGLLIAGVAGNLIYELAHDFPEYDKLWKTWGVEVLAVIILISIAYCVNRLYYEPKLRSERTLEMWDPRPKGEDELEHSYHGIIWLLSPDEKSVDIAQYAIREHKLGISDEEKHGKGKLKVCWCIYGAEEESVKEEFPKRIKELKGALRKKNVRIPEDVKFEEVPIIRPDAQYTFNAVNNIYQHRIQEYELKEHQVIADITGGYASMSAGMMRACSPFGRPVEYIYVPYIRDKSSGKIIRNDQEVSWKHILIDPREQVPTTEREVS